MSDVQSVRVTTHAYIPWAAVGSVSMKASNSGQPPSFILILLHPSSSFLHQGAAGRGCLHLPFLSTVQRSVSAFYPRD